MASSLALEKAFLATAPANGRIIRNLVLGANFIQSHVLHFYHLAALDYINTQGAADMAPWMPRYVTPDMVSGATAVTLVNHYVDALAIRRKAHQMGAIFGGRLPCTSVFVPGGSTERPTAQKITDFRTLLNEMRSFINNVMIPDVQAVAGAFPQYYSIGRGCGNLLAYGVFDLDAAGTTKLLKSGRFTNNQFLTVDPAQITEYVKYSRYTAASGNLNPANGVTEPDAAKAGAYSWIKAPRYLNAVHEVGPLARMWVNGDYRNGISVLDRLAARVLETKKVADAMDGWLNQLVVGGPVYQYAVTPASSLGHRPDGGPARRPGTLGPHRQRPPRPLSGHHADELERLAQGRSRAARPDRAGPGRHAGRGSDPADRGPAGDPFVRPVPVLRRAHGPAGQQEGAVRVLQQAECLTMTETSTRAPILVLGIGNILLRDEGVGVHVVRAMENLPLPDGVELLDGGTAGADLLDAISDRRKLIVVDALDADVPPGTIVRMKPEDLAADASGGISLHEFGIAETLRMARQLNCGPRRGHDRRRPAEGHRARPGPLARNETVDAADYRDRPDRDRRPRVHGRASSLKPKTLGIFRFEPAAWERGHAAVP